MELHFYMILHFDNEINNHIKFLWGILFVVSDVMLISVPDEIGLLIFKTRVFRD